MFIASICANFVATNEVKSQFVLQNKENKTVHIFMQYTLYHMVIQEAHTK